MAFLSKRKLNKLLFLTILIWLTSLDIAAASIKRIGKDFMAQVTAFDLDPEQQAFCVEDTNGSVAAYNEQVRIIPASITKLYTFDFVLDKLGEEFTYKTIFTVRGNTLYITGSGDPTFVDAHLRDVLNHIGAHQKIRITKVVVSPNFYFNWKHTPASVTKALRVFLAKERHAMVDMKVAVSSKAVAYEGLGNRYQFESSPLYDILKQTNNFSTNTVANELFDRAGGTESFTAYMKDTYGVDTNTIYFSGGSGLTGNYTTCELTLRVIKHLEERLRSHKLSVTDVMSIPQIDAGVLKKRLLGVDTRGMVAKSGYISLRQNLAGIINTEKGPLYFAVFGTYRDTTGYKNSVAFIDSFIGKLVSKLTIDPYEYTPKAELTQGKIIKLP